MSAWTRRAFVAAALIGGVVVLAVLSLFGGGAVPLFTVFPVIALGGLAGCALAAIGLMRREPSGKAWLALLANLFLAASPFGILLLLQFLLSQEPPCETC